MVPEPDEGVVRVQKEPAEDGGDVIGVREQEDEAPAADAKLQSVRRGIDDQKSAAEGVGGPLNAETDDEAVAMAAVNEKRC